MINIPKRDSLLIDCFLPDLFLTCNIPRLIIGRPRIYLALEINTRKIHSSLISFNDPDIETLRKLLTSMPDNGQRENGISSLLLKSIVATPEFDSLFNLLPLSEIKIFPSKSHFSGLIENVALSFQRKFSSFKEMGMDDFKHQWELFIDYYNAKIYAKE